MKNRHLLISTLVVFLNGCGGGSDSATQPIKPVEPPKPIEVPTSPATPTVFMKWNPGHYGQSLSTYNPTTINGIHSDWSAIFNADSRFVGVNAFYSWYNLEPKKQGEYDFSPIDNDIAWLNKNYPGKKLIIEIWTRDFTRRTELPTIPQNPNTQNSKIPDYIISGEYEGSNGVSGATLNSNGAIAAFWNPAVLKRLQALDAALAARYDNNPTVEIIKYDEYSPPAPLSGAASLGWSTSNMVQAWKEFHTSMSKNWLSTNKILLGNWPSNSAGSPDKELMPFVESIKTGVGGPDILPPKEKNSPGETWGAMLMYGAGGSYGLTDYRGKIPINYEAQNPYWNMVVSDIESYAYSTLQATHVSWLYNPLNIGSSSWKIGEGKTPWKTSSQYNPNGYSGVLDILKENNFRIHNNCPTVYELKCKNI